MLFRSPRTRSVVIGPSKFPWLNKLHEFGGSVNVYISHGKYPTREYAGQQIPQSLLRTRRGNERRDSRGRFAKRAVASGAYVGVFSNSGGNFRVGTRQVRPRRYMEIGLLRSKAKIPEQFRNRLGGTIPVR